MESHFWTKFRTCWVSTKTPRLALTTTDNDCSPRAQNHQAVSEIAFDVPFCAIRASSTPCRRTGQNITCTACSKPIDMEAVAAAKKQVGCSFGFTTTAACVELIYVCVLVCWCVGVYAFAVGKVRL